MAMSVDYCSFRSKASWVGAAAAALWCSLLQTCVWTLQNAAAAVESILVQYRGQGMQSCAVLSAAVNMKAAHHQNQSHVSTRASVEAWPVDWSMLCVLNA